MNKVVTIRVQNVLSYIPFVNAIVLFVWLHNYRVLNVEYKTFFKSICVIFAATIPIAILQMVLANALSMYPVIVSVVNYVAIYVIPLSLARALIHFQTKVFKTTGDSSVS